MTKVSLTIAVFVLTVTMAGCGGGATVGDCGGCPGCCLNGICQQGTSGAACGISGRQCQACPGGSRCFQGQCVDQNGNYPYNPDNGYNGSNDPNQAYNTCIRTCTGCCTESGQCVYLNNQGPFQCGSRGALCRSCNGAQCNDGQCDFDNNSCSNCSDGCCDNGKCVRSFEQAAWRCGIGGQQCRDCASGGGSGQCNLGYCENERPCDATCTGCCDGNRCVELGAQSPWSCGSYGQQCKQCPNGGQCSNGQCRGCDATTCADGCCDGNTCVRNDQNFACGRGGYQCKQCFGGQTCSDGQCIEALKVLAISARTRSKSGGAWDDIFGAAPDPYLECTAGGVKGRMPGNVANTFNPSFGFKEILTAEKSSVSYGLSCTVMDDDGLLGAQRMGSCSFSGVGSGGGTLTSNNCTEYVDEIQIQITQP